MLVKLDNITESGFTVIISVPVSHSVFASSEKLSDYIHSAKINNLYGKAEKEVVKALKETIHKGSTKCHDSKSLLGFGLSTEKFNKVKAACDMVSIKSQNHILGSFFNYRMYRDDTLENDYLQVRYRIRKYLVREA